MNAEYYRRVRQELEEIRALVQRNNDYVRNLRIGEERPLDLSCCYLVVVFVVLIIFLL